MAQVTIQQAFDLAKQHHQAGRVREAEQIYQLILAQAPEHTDAMHNLAMLFHHAGRPDLAVGLIRRAIALGSNDAKAYCHLGNALTAMGRLNDAIITYRQALILRSNYPEACNNLGNAYREKGQFDEAIAAYRRVIILMPNCAEAYSNLGNVLRDKGQFDEAIVACRQAIALKPNMAEGYDHLGNAQIAKAQIDEAIATYRQALALKPTMSATYDHLGNAFLAKSQLDDGIASFRQSLRLNPNSAMVHVHLALALLLRGDWEEGWLEYEWRWKTPGFPSPQDRFPQPLWDGGDLNGRTILLHAEQGIGDTIQFIRYLPLVVERGGRVFVEAQSALIRLLRQLPGVEQWITRGDPQDPLPSFDVQCPLPNLPRLFQTTPQTIPSQKDILLPDPDLAQAWRHRLEQQPPGFKVGLVWAGNPRHENDANRSITLSLLAPLAAVNGLHFYSLQKGEAAKQTADPPANMRIIDWTNDLHDFADTTALVAQLDLVISIDTSVAHLAAAMGKPVWLLLPSVPDWRWTQNRDDSTWYPTMRLFRQTTFGDWPGAIGRVVEALAALRAHGPT